jgi:hypothetical protein
MSLLTRSRPSSAVEEPVVDDAIAVLTRSFESRTVRVNLLPPEIGEARRLRTVQAGLAGTALLITGAVGGLWWQEHGKLVQARADQSVAQEAQTNLQHQIVRFSPVDAVFKQVDKANLMLSSAAQGNIDWARLMDGLAQHLPTTTWLTNASLAGCAPATSTAAAAAAAASPYGTITLTGDAETMIDGAALVDGLGATPGLTNVFLTGLTTTTGPNGTYVAWTATASLTADALIPTTGGAGR